MPVLFTLTVALFAIVTVAAFSFAVRGLFGVRFSLVRLLMAGIVSAVLGTPILEALVGPEVDTGSGLFPALWFWILGAGCALLAGMVFLVIAEALVPSYMLPGPIYTVRSLRRRWHRGARYLEIARVIVRHGLWAYLRGGRRAELKSPEGRAQLARSLRRALNDGGVTYVKLGQVMSTRRDLLPVEFVEELSHLQVQASPVPWPWIEETLRSSLGRGVDDVFDTFERAPLAAASIAQVHAATLRNEALIVKVRRPGIMTQVERDLDIIGRLADVLQRSTAWGRSIGVVDLANGFAVALREELDLRVEARNLAVVAGAADARGGDPGLYIPRVHRDVSSERVLVMERLAGVPLGEARPVIAARGLDGTMLARNLLNSLLRQIMIDGTFHADPHPGNVMLLDDNRLTLLDFGSVGRIDGMLRQALMQLIVAFDHGEPRAAADALLEIADRPLVLDQRRLERALGRFMARHMTPGVPPDARVFTDFFRVIAEFGLTVPPEVAAVFRTITTLDGTLRIVDPGFNLIREARGFAVGYITEQMHPKVLLATVRDELIDLLPMLRGMPRRLDRVISALEDGRLDVNLRPLPSDRDRRGLSGMLHEVLLTILASTAGVMAVIMIGQDGGPVMTDTVTMFQFIGYALLVLAFILAMRVLLLVFRPEGG